MGNSSSYFEQNNFTSPVMEPIWLSVGGGLPRAWDLVVGIFEV